MRDIKFRVFDSRTNQMSRDFVFINFITKTMGFYAINSLGEKKIFERDMDNFPIMQYTGLKDKNGVEIYEYMEIDNTYEVSFLNGSYVLTNISNGDIMLLSNYMENHNGKVEITREYTKV